MYSTGNSVQYFVTTCMGKKSKNESLHHCKSIIHPWKVNSKFKRQFKDWEEIFSNHISDYISLSHFWLFATPWTIACSAHLSMGFPRQEYWRGSHFLLQGMFPTQGLNPCFLHCRQILYRLSLQRIFKDLRNSDALKFHELSDHSEKAMAPHSSTLAWKIPWM